MERKRFRPGCEGQRRSTLPPRSPEGLPSIASGSNHSLIPKISTLHGTRRSCAVSNEASILGVLKRPPTRQRNFYRCVESSGRTDDIAWESNRIARSDIYLALRIPVEPCEPPAGLCGNEPDVGLSSTYMDQAEVIAGHQLARAGFRLASLLNGIWRQPIVAGGNEVVRSASSAGGASASVKPMGPIVANRRSRIYAWPGCKSYDTMAPQNRVVFPNSHAAEQAGYRAAYNCPR
jgi:hypothetical protein